MDVLKIADFTETTSGDKLAIQFFKESETHHARTFAQR
ncbi:MAG: hypothetical protein ACI9LD_000384 [Polaromonas sp.]|jgi:hypothetical protein